ncbi:serine/threonine protein kinase [Sorangium sp. So ce1151]|uniref:serine/threonine protein kinase n=1 Tax=Sorangium sp. So ce1151 TaxID=3133332 RepID=UPI003F63A984
MVSVGDEFAGHRLVSELDEGMLRTFLARQLGDTDALVWLHLREQVTFDRAVFLAELRHLVRLSEEVPKVHSVLYGDVSSGSAWAASPYLAGARGLLDATDGAELGPAAIQLVIELGERLSRCYDLGWVHATLRPDRVLVTPDDGHAITHFGLGRLFDLGGREFKRSPRYAAPELLKEGTITQRTDVYGLGTVLYELVCRRELYAGHENLIVSALTRPPEFPIATPRALRELIAKALAKDPRDRYPNVEHLVAHLHEIAADWRDLRSRDGTGRAFPIQGARPALPDVDVAPTSTKETGEAEKESSTPSPAASEAMPQRNAPAGKDRGGAAQASGMKLPVLRPAPRRPPEVPVSEPSPNATAGPLDGKRSDPQRRKPRSLRLPELARSAVALGLLGLLAVGVGLRPRSSVELAASLARVVQSAAMAAATQARVAAPAPTASPVALAPTPSPVAAPPRAEKTTASSRRSRIARRLDESARPVLDGSYCEDLYPCEHEPW